MKFDSRGWTAFELGDHFAQFFQLGYLQVKIRKLMFRLIYSIA